MAGFYFQTRTNVCSVTGLCKTLQHLPSPWSCGPYRSIHFAHWLPHSVLPSSPGVPAPTNETPASQSGLIRSPPIRAWRDRPGHVEDVNVSWVMLWCRVGSSSWSRGGAGRVGQFYLRLPRVPLAAANGSARCRKSEIALHSSEGSGGVTEERGRDDVQRQTQ